MKSRACLSMCVCSERVAAKVEDLITRCLMAFRGRSLEPHHFYPRFGALIVSEQKKEKETLVESLQPDPLKSWDPDFRRRQAGKFDRVAAGQILEVLGILIRIRFSGTGGAFAKKTSKWHNKIKRN